MERRAHGAGSPACVRGVLRCRDHRTWQSRPHRKLWWHRNDQPRPGQRPAIWHICTWCSIPVRQTAVMPNRFMASRIRLCACRIRSPVHAADVWRFLTSYELLVAHNAAFDLRFINREMRLAGLPTLTRPVYCTMQGYRALGLGGSASLSAVCRHIKLARAGDLHDAIEDAWLAMQIYLWLHGCPLQRSIARLASSHSIQLPSRCDRPIPCRWIRAAQCRPVRQARQASYSPCRCTRLTFVTMDGRRAGQRWHPGRGRS